MENGDEERTDTPYFPVLIAMARTLVRTALRRLDSVNLMKHARAPTR